MAVSLCSLTSQPLLHATPLDVGTEANTDFSHLPASEEGVLYAALFPAAAYLANTILHLILCGRSWSAVSFLEHTYGFCSELYRRPLAGLQVEISQVQSSP